MFSIEVDAKSGWLRNLRLYQSRMAEAEGGPNGWGRGMAAAAAAAGATALYDGLYTQGYFSYFGDDCGEWFGASCPIPARGCQPARNERAFIHGWEDAAYDFGLHPRYRGDGRRDYAAMLAAFVLFGPLQRRGRSRV